VQSQITTGGVDVETLGNPHDLIRISAAGDTFEGFNGQFLMSFWSSL
jgi:hypothetical protein